VKNLAILALLGLTALGFAQTDHDNLDKGRPLSFEDAEPIPLGGLAFEFGLTANFLRRNHTRLGMPLGIVYGGAPDTQFELGTGLAWGRGDSFRADHLELGVLHSFRRETRTGPALALRAEAEIPTERGEEAQYRLRGIMTRGVRQYDRVHLNLDVDFIPTAGAGANKARLGGIVGYTTPVGYPTHFDTTALGEISLRQGERRGDPTIWGAGIGIRRQMTPRSVLDVGIQTELTGRDRVPLRFIAGYSTSF
jgi:hypothetical protein